MLQWLQLPLWLMQLHLTPAACIVYALISNRHRLSVRTNADHPRQWIDDQGVYCIYPRAELAAAAGLSITSITRAVGELVAAGLIIDRRLGQGQPNRLYIVDQAEADAVPDPVPDIQRADQLSLDNLMPDLPEQAAPEAEQAAPEAEQAAPEAEQAAPEAEQAAPRIEATTIQESKRPRISYNKKNQRKKYSARSSNISDNLSAIRRCLTAAYGLDPDTIPHEYYTTAIDRTSTAHAVRNPVTYAAAIIAQLVTVDQPQENPLTDYDHDYFAAVRAYEATHAVV